MIFIFLIRLAAKSNLSADVLVSKVTECSSKWSKSTLQLVHQLWTEHGALLHAHQEVLTMASIGQVCHMILAYSVNLDQSPFSVSFLMIKASSRLACRYPVEAWNGSELRYLPVPQLPVHLCCDENCGHIRRDVI